MHGGGGYPEMQRPSRDAGAEEAGAAEHDTDAGVGGQVGLGPGQQT